MMVSEQGRFTKCRMKWTGSMEFAVITLGACIIWCGWSISGMT